MSELKQEFDNAMAQLTGESAPYEVATDTAGLRYYKSAPADLREALSVARDHGDREFLIYEGERRTFNQLMDEADAIGAALQAAGVVKGDRVALAMRNYPEWMAAFIGIVGIGAVVVPVNSWGQPADIAYTVEDAGAKLVICDQQRYDGVVERFVEKGIRTLVARPTDASNPDSLDTFVADFRDKVPQRVEIDGDALQPLIERSLADERVDALVVPIGKGELVCRKI